MSEYKTLFGKAVKALASDPTDPGAEGQIWYNTTTGSFRTVLATGAWSSGGNMTSALQGLAGAGSQTVGLATGGQTPPAGPAVATTNEYNGSSWTAGGSLNTARRLLGAGGTQTAALAFGGYLNLTNSESYDGSTWTATNVLGTGLHGLAGSGTLTAGLAAGGAPQEVNTQEFDGTNWTAGGNLNTGRSYLTMKGTQTSSLAIGGQTATADAATEQYNGTSWTSVNPLNTARLGLGSGGENDSQAVAFTGGTPSYTDVTEIWDGTNWTTSPATVANSRQYVGSAGSATAALLFGGRNPPGIYFSATEEWNVSIYSPVAATWASGGSLPAVRQSAGQAGTQTAMVLAGGRNPANTTNTTFTYDGSTWSPVNNLGTARSLATMFGTQTAAVLAASGDSGPPFTSTTATEEWDGTNWTAGGAMNTSRFGSFAGGTLTQGVIAGGSGPSVYFDDTEEYNGTAWTTVTNMPADQGNGTSGADSQLDMSCVGGGPGNQTTHTIYNGTTWTAGNSLTGDGRRGNRGAMPSSSSPGFTAGGESATVNPITATEEYDGTSFSSSTSIPTATRDAAGSDGGTGAAGLFSGGATPSITANTFEWTGATNPLDYKTITTS